VLKKLSKNKDGFTLTEVLIAVMVLTVAVVTSSNLLVQLIRSNDTNVKSIQAYYLAIEGIEGVRQIRDTNWLHNSDWLESTTRFNLWGGEFEIGGEYSITLKQDGFNKSPNSRGLSATAITNDVIAARTWEIGDSGDAGIDWISDGEGGTGETSPFERIITISDYSDEDDYILVESKVSWGKEDINGEKDSIVLTEILTDWKGGAL
jgi:prepilin-type N-terminal cleavage/methylation domain-containing protein